jgi:ribosome biogenesis GTPase
MNLDDYDLYEKKLLGENRRSFKRERVLQTKQDRSKYKKTDQKKELTAVKSGDQGRIISLEPGFCYVLSNDDELFLCSLRGTLKHEKTRKKNLIAIGDFVQFVKLNEKQGVITAIQPRTSLLSRTGHYTKLKSEQIIAANVDQVLIVSSILSPSLKPALIDRYIIATRKGNMNPVVLINKIDLLKEKTAIIEELKLIYKQLDIPFITVSAITGEGLEELKEVMRNKTSVFSGQSGVGKTSLINEVTSSNLRVGDIIEKTHKGAHTTTKATLVPLIPSGFCIDTPGIKSFGLWELTLQEIQDYFIDFTPYKACCKYPNCSHIHEPNCKLQEAVENGEVSSYRYQSYATIIEEVQNGDHKTY